MQKKIIALAIAAAFAAPVAAMAEVTVYGSVDAGVRTETFLGKTITSFGIPSGTYNSNRLGFKASEDMGNGMKANVVLESSLAVGTGETANYKTATTNADVDFKSTMFDRQATVGISSGSNSIDLGRQYTVAFKTVSMYDPMGMKFIKLGYGEAAAMGTRYNNDIGYTGKFGEITVMAEHNIPAATTTDYTLATSPVGDDSTSTSAVGVGYASGPIAAGAAYSATKAAVGSIADATYMTVGGAYNFGDGKVSAGYSKGTTKNATVDAVTTYTFIGASYNMSSSIGLVAAMYKKVANAAGSSTDVASTKTVLGATYAMSKVTKVYVELDKQTVDAPSGTGAATNDNNGFSVGLSTAF